MEYSFYVTLMRQPTKQRKTKQKSKKVAHFRVFRHSCGKRHQEANVHVVVDTDTRHCIKMRKQ